VDVQAVELFTSLLSLVALGGAVLLIIARLLAPRVQIAADAVRAVSSVALPLAWLVAAGATLGSLYFSEVANYTPCRLCWYQRIAMYPLAVILLVAMLRRDRAVKWYAVPVAGIGAAISAYHYLIEWKPSFDSGSCDVTVPCTIPWFRELGFVTLAFMAFAGFVAIITLLTVRYEET
jgi:disulfide bond formation protein DsbB